MISGTIVGDQSLRRIVHIRLSGLVYSFATSLISEIYYLGGCCCYNFTFGTVYDESR